MQQNIRPYRIDDCAAMAAIANVAMPYPWSKQVFRDCFSASGYLGWVMTLDRQLRGFCIVKQGDIEAELMTICVEPVAQGMGVATALLETALRSLIKQGCKRVNLEVRRSNVVAIALYQKLGFVEVGVRKNYYPLDQGREDALLFYLNLDGSTL